jgi:exopolysaccharide biosynthesis protein
MGGSTVHQVFDWLKMLGATDAVTMDGGGSTTMYIQNGGALKRQDVPDSAWLRDVVVGMALVAKD